MTIEDGPSGFHKGLEKSPISLGGFPGSAKGGKTSFSEKSGYDVAAVLNFRLVSMVFIDDGDEDEGEDVVATEDELEAEEVDEEV